jgi:uncharacterized protein YggE
VATEIASSISCKKVSDGLTAMIFFVISLIEKGNYMQNLIFMLMMLFASASFGQPEIKGSPEDLKGFLYPKDNLVAIAETADEKAYSDTAVVNLVITTEEKLTSVALKANSDIRHAIVEKLKSIGIPSENINNAKFSSSPQFGWFGKKPDAYKIVNRISVKISEESQMQKIAEISDSFPECVISGTIFEHSKKDLYVQKVKEKALAKVMARKAFYESSLGVKLVPVSFIEKGNFIQATQGAGAIEEVVVTAMRSSGIGYSKHKDEQYTAPESSFDEVRYESNLVVEFKIQ